MIASGDIRRNFEKQTRVREAAEQMLEALRVMDLNDPGSPEAVQAKDRIIQATREAMAATGVRQPA